MTTERRTGIRRRLGRTGLLVSASAGAAVALLASLALSGPPHGRAVSYVRPHPTTTQAVRPTTTTATTISTTPPVTTTVRPVAGVSLGGCPNLPADSVWHASVAALPVLPRSAQFVASIGATASVHADFGAGLWDGGPIGIPVTYVPGGQRPVAVTFTASGDESDPGPYPVPANAAVEGGPNSSGDRHVLVVDTGTCRLYELYDAHPAPDGSWTAGSGAVFDLNSDKLRPRGWTSADAAGLPITPGLVRYEEVAAGHIDHAIRITVPRTQQAFLWPARHAASNSTDPTLPPMGLRLRLKSTVDILHLPPQARIIARAMQTEGVIVADNGSPWYISGTPDPRWNNDDLHALGTLTGTDFEAVDTSTLLVDPNTAQAH